MGIHLTTLALLLPCLQESPSIDARRAGKESPAEEFQRIGRELYDSDCPPVGIEPARSIERMLDAGQIEPEKRVAAMQELGREWVELGRVKDAIPLLEKALAQAEAEGAAQKQVARLHRELGIAWLRLAEDQNCIERHNGSCCILPVSDDALHSVREPALKAREHYLASVRGDPSDLGPRWVLNLLSLLLGDYPDGVPDELRIPLQAFANSGAEPQFRDVATRAGIDGFNLAGGAAAEDFDGDGWTDILTSTSDPMGPLLYYRNRGDGTFEDRSEASHASEQLGGLDLITADYDNDGDQDACVLRGGWMLDYGRVRKSLLRNDRGQTFVDVTRAAGVAAPAFPTQAGVFADFDGDGWLDLYVGNESRLEQPYDKAHAKPGEQSKGDYPSQLFQSNGDGTFRDVTAGAGVRNDRYAKGAAAGDYDDDGDMDLYVSNVGVNRLYRNDGHARFEDVAAKAGVEEPRGRSFGTWFFDYDNDGRLDLWVAGYSATIVDLAAHALGKPYDGAPPCLYHNSGDGTFQDRAKEMGLSRPMAPMGSNFGDIDNDGWLDIYLGTGDPGLQSLMPNLLFRNVGGKRYEDRTAASGLGHLQKGHGVAFADFDHDGDQDIFHQLGGFFRSDKYKDALFENTIDSGHWLALELVGTRTNRSGVGARIKVVVEGPSGKRELHRAPGCVGSFGGSTHRQEIGLGDATRILRLEIRWPRTSELSVFEDVPLDARLRVTEGKAEFERLEMPTFRF